MNPCTVKNIFKTYIQFSNQLVALSFATFIIYHIFLKFQAYFLKNIKNNILEKTYNQQGVKERETPYGYVDCKCIKDGSCGEIRILN